MKCTRRQFTSTGFKLMAAATLGFVSVESILKGTASGDENTATRGYDWNKHFYEFVVDTTKCIGCGRCATACKNENNVPFDEQIYRTWIERYVINKDDKIIIDSPDGGVNGFPDIYDPKEIKKTFYVPKLCNHCDNPPCVQVCPVGATYMTNDGVVLIDKEYCVGCRYCIQACPYGARFINPELENNIIGKGVADKCTWCYHRITRGLLPACVEACPVGARKFGDKKDEHSMVNEILATERINVLKPDLGTKPKVYYVGLDKEVR